MSGLDLLKCLARSRAIEADDLNQTLAGLPLIEQWLAEARQGSSAALGQLMDSCRRYLLGIANRELPQHLHCKVAPSDLVQDTFVEAQRDFERFDGQRREELLAWLRQILLNNLANATRRYRDTEMRDVALELSLDADAAEGRHTAELQGRDTPPPLAAQVAEMGDRLTSAIEQLPEDFRQVVLLRHREDLSFTEIGARMDRSPGAVRKLWLRAIEWLQNDLAADDDA